MAQGLEAAPGFEPAEGGGFSDFDDPLYGPAKEVVIQAKKASASLLQRRLRIGYARAARLLDILEEQGLVGPAEGAKPREVLIKNENNNLPENNTNLDEPNENDNTFGIKV